MPTQPLDATQVRRRNNVREVGDPGGRPIVFAHGFGCSQEAWTRVIPYFEADYRVVLYDNVGVGGSDVSAYDPSKYDSLHGYADDSLEVLEALDLHDAVFVGHSVGAMVGVLAANADPSRFGALVLVGPSPRYVNQGEYRGGFEQADIDGLIESLDANYLGWSRTMAPVIAGTSNSPAIGEELAEMFCTVDPEVARQFARVTFLSDNRRDLERVTVPTLVLQNSDDVIAPDEVGAFVHEHIPGSSLVRLSSSGHMPNLTAPRELADAIRAYLA